MALALAIGAVQLSAQDPSAQSWPPDDDYNSGTNGQPVPIPQYTPSQQYGASQPQYPQDYPQQQQAYGDAPNQQGYGPTQQPLSPNDLTQLVAPIALYPDALVAQILTAATYPAEVSAADQWRRSMGNAPAEQIAAGADAQTTWDPSIKALTAFPQVLDNLASNLQWTTALGNAYYNQPQDVMQTIQVMRERAQQAGNLQSTPQQQVTENGGYIDIAPANPQVVYVPTYNPWVVYGAPVVAYPGYSFIGGVGSFFAGPVQFGLGFAMGAFMHASWGFFGWGLDWFSHCAIYHHNDYWTHSSSVRDWGFPRGGPRGYPGNPQSIHGGDRYGSHNNGGYNRAGSQPGNGFTHGPARPVGSPMQPVQRLGDARTQAGLNRGNEPYGRPAPPTQQAFNRPQQAFNRPQEAFNNRQEQFQRPSYGSSSYGQAHNNYISRPGMYTSPSPIRTPQNTYSGRTFNGYGATQSWGSQPRGSSGFNNYGGSALRTYSYNGGGRSPFGGSSGGGWKAPKETHSFGGGSFGGGGRSFGGGGGHSFGGGGGHSFSGGGHSGGGHSGGGGHHR